jgi:hypothetical protein
MGGSYWFYNKFGESQDVRRVLLVQKSKDKKDAKIEDIRKSFRSMGVTTCQ